MPVHYALANLLKDHLNEFELAKEHYERKEFSKSDERFLLIFRWVEALSQHLHHGFCGREQKGLGLPVNGTCTV